VRVELALDAAGDGGRAQRRQRLAQDDRTELVRLAHDGVALRGELAPRHEQRRPRPCPPLCNAGRSRPGIGDCVAGEPRPRQQRRGELGGPGPQSGGLTFRRFRVSVELGRPVSCRRPAPLGHVERVAGPEHEAPRLGEAFLAPVRLRPRLLAGSVLRACAGLGEPTIGLGDGFRRGRPLVGEACEETLELERPGPQCVHFCRQLVGLRELRGDCFVRPLELAEQREALIRYEQAIQQAFREVEDALVAHRRAREALAEQDAAVRASREALAIAELRYTSGLTSYLNVLDAQRTLLTAELAQSRTLRAQLVAVVQLYRALGGGWAQESGQARLP